MVKNSYTIILIILFSFNMFQAGENFYRDYTASTSHITSAETEKDHSWYTRTFKHYGYLRNKDLCNNVLVSLGSNNKLFTCYSGYKKVDHWTICGGNYRRDPVIKETTNILTETDVYTKIEYKFDDLPEICNEHPVNDIARWKNNYYIAHENNVYVYQSTNPWFTSLTLSRTHHLNSNAAGDIKKIFIDEEDNVIAVSSYGAILKSHSAQPSAESQILSLISQSFPRDEKLYSMAYNTQNNMVLLGGHNFIHVVLLGDAKKTLNIPSDNLRINTIDTNDDYALLSDVDSNCDRFKIRQNEGHLERENCCIEKQRPYDQWKECVDCINARSKWQQDKNAWENETVTISETISRKDILDKAQEQSTYKIPQPTPCSHRIPPVETNTLMRSCRHNTILLLSLSKLLSAIRDTDHFDLKTSELLVNSILYNPKSKKKMLTNALLTKDFLFIGHHKGGRNPYSDFIYKIPLKDIQSTDINKLLSHKKYDARPKELFYYSEEKYYPSKEWDLEGSKYYRPLLIRKTTEEHEKIAIIKTNIPSSRWTDGNCFAKQDWLQKICDVIVFTKNDQTDSSWSRYLTRQFKRCWQTKLKAFAYTVIFTSPILLGYIALLPYLINE